MFKRCFTLLIFLKVYKTEIALRHLQQNEFTNMTYGRSSQAWQLYIKAFLFNIIRTSLKSDFTLPVFLHISALQSHSFVNHSWRKVNMSEFQIIKHPFHTKLIYDFEVEAYHFQINWASGRIYLLNPTILFLRTYTFSFNLDNIFTLNTTFYRLSFFRVQDHCNSALVVRNNLNRTKDTKPISFCGYYATFNFYSTYSNVIFDFALYINGQVLPFEFNGSFAVIDKNFITYIGPTVKLRQKVSSNLTYWNHFHNYRILNILTLISYFIKAKKMFQVVFPNLSSFCLHIFPF